MRSAGTEGKTGDQMSGESVPISNAKWLVTFAAAGVWQQVGFLTEDAARALYTKPALNRSDWPREPRLWRVVE